MRDLSRAKSERQADADGTKAEDNRQLTELLLQNKVSVPQSIADLMSADSDQRFLTRAKTLLIVFITLPLFLLAYFSSRTEEDDFYA